MERVDEIMARLGFKKEADDGVKIAFFKNLMKQAYGIEPEISAGSQSALLQESQVFSEVEIGKPSLLQVSGPAPGGSNGGGRKEVQLSFNLDDLPPKAG